MKKIMLSAVAVMLGMSAAVAQKTNKDKLASHLSIGPVVSFGHSWTSNVGEKVRFKPSPAAGIGLVYSRNEHWGLGAQLLVSHEGFKQQLGTNLVGQPIEDGPSGSVNPVYLRLPLQVTYFFGKYGDKVRPKVYAGPSVAVRVDEVRYFDGESMNTANDTYGRADFGLTAGLGANIRLSKLTWLNLDAGYYHGLVDVIPEANNDKFNGNRNVHVNVGLMWGL